MLRVARAVIPFMAQRKRGLIVNIGSIAGDMLVQCLVPLSELLTGNNRSPTPWAGIYCATKAAVKSLSDVLSMECRPFNIDVMLVTPGAVRSNISKNHASTFALPSDSLYAAYVDNIVERMNASENLNSMPTKSFASKVVAKALMVPPATHLAVGGGVLLFYILGWLPRQWLLSLVWRRLSRTH
jgi:1-acylglycerone phosphate reductase